MKLVLATVLVLSSLSSFAADLGERSNCNVDLSCSDKCQVDKMVKECGMTTVEAQKIVDSNRKSKSEDSSAQGAKTR